MLQCPLIGILSVIHIDKIARHPEIIPTKRILPLIKRFLPFRLGLPAHLDPFDRAILWHRHIYIQQRTIRQIIGQHRLHDGFDVGLYHLEIGIPAVIAQRKSNGFHPIDRCFHRGTHGTRINHIDAGIAAVIYA